MNKLYFYLVICVPFILASCYTEEITSPGFGDKEILSQTIPLNDDVKVKISGIYNVIAGGHKYGDKAILKWFGDTLSIFTGGSYAHFLLKGGYKNSEIVFEGTWRYIYERKVGLARLFIKKDEGGDYLTNGEGGDYSNIIIRGAAGNNADDLSNKFELNFERKLPETGDDFKIIAHRGGSSSGRCFDHSENSSEIIRDAEKYGANGIEIDVRLTKDGIPILFHDDKFSPRTINGEFFIGPVSNYYYGHIRAFARLKNGEKIPTLEEALNVVVYETKLSLVWLDVKSVETLKKIMPVRNLYMEKAKEMNRKLEIMIGLATDETVNEYIACGGPELSQAICELDFGKVRRTNAAAWGPRWTMGSMDKEIDEMHNENRRVFIWTIDKREYLNIFLKNLKADGILSNYTPMVFYEYVLKNS